MVRGFEENFRDNFEEIFQDNFEEIFRDNFEEIFSFDRRAHRRQLFDTKQNVWKDRML